MASQECLEIKVKPPQLKILSSKKRFVMVNAGRRFGKSYLSGYAILKQVSEKPGSVIWYVAPTAKMAKKIMWDSWLPNHVPKSYIAETNKVDGTYKFINGSILYVLSADDPDNLRGSGVDLMILDECAFMKEGTYEVIYPVLSDKYHEGKGLFISTPKGYNWFKKRWDKAKEDPEHWDCFQFTTIEGGNVSEEEIEEAKRQMSPKMFAQEYLASFETLSSRVYDQYNRELNLCELDDTWGLGDLHIGIDFNVNPMTAAIAVEEQTRSGIDLNFFDEIVEPNSNTQWLCDEIKKRYPRADIWVYPDPTCKKRQTSAAAGITDFEILKRNGFHVCVPRAPYPSRDKFNAVNTAMCNAKGERHVHIARGRCNHLKEGFDGYCYKENGQETDKSTGLDHITDAAAYLIAYKLPVKNSYGLNRPRVFGL